MLVQTVGKGKAMRAEQIDKVRIAFGPDKSFGTTDYYEVRRNIKLPDDRTLVPKVFLKAFAEPHEKV